ncbi:hypothetical protein [Mycobacterium hubeiense]|uniref:hypothetical protein n=1 Tax=Mycobacterium hubeiense TaxID=1867256 RepID=UPI000C7EE3F3|nr:hypothetical protein [Mycobacterium sp. QGD 101]
MATNAKWAGKVILAALAAGAMVTAGPASTAMADDTDTAIDVAIDEYQQRIGLLSEQLAEAIRSGQLDAANRERYNPVLREQLIVANQELVDAIQDIAGR